MEIPTQQNMVFSQLNAWKDTVNKVRVDVKDMSKRLEGICKSYNQNVMIQVERFQNQFIRQLEVADEMFHDIKQTAKSLDHQLPVRVIHDDRPVDDYSTMQDRMATFQKLYQELKNDFQYFETHR
ncbi:hypothetical protein COR50_06905 [Chitinophaga caeni]|uniref:Uncharacterized protein n=1 Tax=Chitinophaga caeni TaxID=2029983 RepID=A0A291QST0_9BACT|nr:hypothetical protein [Chitinophaga caeni]ATL46932.1 hypothetical protein COR50_06905 [Chitinophaga caeni]